MTRAEKLKMLDDLFTAHDEIQCHIDALKTTLNPDPGCAVYESVFKLLDVAINATAAAIGDNSNWLDWMVHENDCGRNGHEAGPINDMRRIQSAEDLLYLMVHENGLAVNGQSGRHGHEAGYSDAIRPIRTAADLLELVEEVNA